MYTYIYAEFKVFPLPPLPKDFFSGSPVSIAIHTGFFVFFILMSFYYMYHMCVFFKRSHRDLNQDIPTGTFRRTHYTDTDGHTQPDRQMHMHTCLLCMHIYIYHVNTIYYNRLKTFQAVHMDIYIQEWLNRIYQITQVEVRLLLLWCTQTKFGTQHLYNLQAFKIGTCRSASVAFDDEQDDLFCSAGPQGKLYWPHFMHLKNEEKI